MLTCSPQKLAKAKMDEYAEQAALVSSLVDEVKALVPIPDDILQASFAQAYIENDPQVHLEICSGWQRGRVTSAPRIWLCSKR